MRICWLGWKRRCKGFPQEEVKTKETVYNNEMSVSAGDCKVGFDCTLSLFLFGRKGQSSRGSSCFGNLCIFVYFPLVLEFHPSGWPVQMCSLYYFGFLHSAELTVSFWAGFSSPIHLAVQDIAVDSPSARNCDYVTIMALKTHLFCKGCLIHYWPEWVPLRAVHTLLA